MIKLKQTTISYWIHDVEIYNIQYTIVKLSVDNSVNKSVNVTQYVSRWVLQPYCLHNELFKRTYVECIEIKVSNYKTHPFVLSKIERVQYAKENLFYGWFINGNDWQRAYNKFSCAKWR